MGLLFGAHQPYLNLQVCLPLPTFYLPFPQFSVAICLKNAFQSLFFASWTNLQIVEF